jgi:hypothetical protein
VVVLLVFSVVLYGIALALSHSQIIALIVGGIAFFSGLETALKLDIFHGAIDDMERREDERHEELMEQIRKKKK